MASSSCVSNLQAAASSFFSPSFLTDNDSRSKKFKNRVVRVRAETAVIEKLGIKIERNPPESRLAQLRVKEWPRWDSEERRKVGEIILPECRRITWSFGVKSTCYLLEGKVKASIEGLVSEFVEIEARDLVVFPAGMNCVWDISKAVDMHYLYE